MASWRLRLAPAWRQSRRWTWFLPLTWPCLRRRWRCSCRELAMGIRRWRIRWRTCQGDRSEGGGSEDIFQVEPEVLLFSLASSSPSAASQSSRLPGNQGFHDGAWLEETYTCYHFFQLIRLTNNKCKSSFNRGGVLVNVTSVKAKSSF